MKKNVIIGSRESRLAVIQSEMVKEYIEKNNPELSVSLLTMKTTGDIILDRTLDKVGGKGLFVKELDKALAEERSDLSVHSLKDMPMETPEALPLIAFSKREDPRDVLVLPKGAAEMDKSRPIGCSGPRRILQLKELFPDCQFKSVRGNVLTRLEKLDRGEYGALVLAAAGLKRLGLADRICRYFEPEEIIPAAGQGILAVQGRKDEDYSCLDGFEDRDSALAAKAERAFVRTLNGGCSSPVAAHGTVSGDQMLLRGLYYDEETETYIKGTMTGSAEEAEGLGRKLAQKLVQELQENGRRSQCGRNGENGKVWLVGAGPGDLGLFTLKGLDALEHADVVVYDSLVGPGVLSCIPETAETINVGKRASHHTMKQEDINRTLAEQAKLGRRVVRLKGGDPFLFGRGGEEVETLIAEGIPFEVVPGVTAAVSVPAYNGIPVTHRDFCSSLHIITGHKRAGMEYDIDFEALVRTKGTLVFLMGVSALADICSSLIEAGMEKDMPAAILQKGTTAGQKRIVATVSTLTEEVERQGIETPAIIVVGKVCALADAFSWHEKLPLSGKRILLTRPKNRVSNMAASLRRLGAEVASVPSISTAPCDDQQRLSAAMKKLNTYDWIAFTSPYGVKVFFDRMRKERIDVRSLCGVKVAAIGSATKKAIEEKGVLVDLMPEIFDGGSLGRALAEACEIGARILLPRAEAGASEILEALTVKNLLADDIPTYTTSYARQDCIDLGKLLSEGEIHCAAFTSASSVEGFAKAAEGADFAAVKAACIGEKTAERARAYGMETYVAEEASVASLTELIVQLKEKEII